MSDRELCEQLGATMYRQKPFELCQMEELGREIKALLDSGGSAAPAESFEIAFRSESV